MEIAPTREQQMALSFLQTSNSIATAQQLAEYRMATVKTEDGKVVPAHPRYGQLKPGPRINWLKDQLLILNYLRHIKTATPLDILIDAQAADNAIMDSGEYRNLTQVEMQEAFNRGINGEYGEFFGITASTLTGFLKGYMKSQKWQSAKAIIYSREKEETITKEQKLEYEMKAHGLKLPFWPSTREKKKVSAEESKAHREKIEKQREEILKAQTKNYDTK